MPISVLLSTRSQPDMIWHSVWLDIKWVMTVTQLSELANIGPMSNESVTTTSVDNILGSSE